jgi:hypothetical protein
VGKGQQLWRAGFAQYGGNRKGPHTPKVCNFNMIANISCGHLGSFSSDLYLLLLPVTQHIVVRKAEGAEIQSFI